MPRVMPVVTIDYSTPIQYPNAFLPAVASDGSPLLHENEVVVLWTDLGGSIGSSYSPWQGAPFELGPIVPAMVRLFVTTSRLIYLAYNYSYAGVNYRPRRAMGPISGNTALGGQVPHANLRSVWVSPPDWRDEVRMYALALYFGDGEATYGVELDVANRPPEYLRDVAQRLVTVALHYRYYQLGHTYDDAGRSELHNSLLDPSPQVITTGKLSGSLQWELPCSLDASETLGASTIVPVDVRKWHLTQGEG